MIDFEIVFPFEGYVNRKEVLPTGHSNLYQFSKDFFQTLPQWELIQTLLSLPTDLVELKVELKQSLFLSSKILDEKTLEFDLDNPYDLRMITLVPDRNDEFFNPQRLNWK